MGACYDLDFLAYFRLVNDIFELFIYLGILTCTESLLAVFKFIYAVWIHYLVYHVNQPFHYIASRPHRSSHRYSFNKVNIHSFKTHHRQHYIAYRLVVIALSYIPLNNTNTPMS